MPISVIIEKDLVNSVKESSVQNSPGFWINGDINVFLPLAVLEQCNYQSQNEETFVSQEEAQELFFKLEKLYACKSSILGEWEVKFIKSLSKWFDSGMKFSKKQKAKIKMLSEMYSADLAELAVSEKGYVGVESDPIPF